MSYRISAKIHKMPRRRQKIAVKKVLIGQLNLFVGKENSPILRANIGRILFDRLGVHADLHISPITPIEHITISPKFFNSTYIL